MILQVQEVLFNKDLGKKTMYLFSLRQDSELGLERKINRGFLREETYNGAFKRRAKPSLTMFSYKKYHT